MTLTNPSDATQQALQSITRELNKGTLISFVGAGVSRAYTDERTGRRWPGLPAAAEVVNQLAEEFSFINPSMPFSEAFFMLKVREGRTALENFLLDRIDRQISPLPAHTLLAHAGFSAYVTSNYDGLLEKALSKARRTALTIIEDSDVARLGNAVTPLVKYHGCITRPKTIVAASDEYLPLSEVSPIINSLLTTLVANKAVLFSGYGLSDPDFIAMYESVCRRLGEHKPKSYAITRKASEYQREYWKTKGLTLVESDLTDFLRGLVTQAQATPVWPKVNISESWVNNAFFESLNAIRTKPSETQVIDSFLQHMVEELEHRALDQRDVVISAVQAKKLVLEARPNFVAFQAVADDATAHVEAALNDSRDPAIALRQFMHKREFISIKSAEHGRLVKRSENLATFSQSQRVLQLLKGVPKNTQSTCKLYVAECRPKSPSPFQDALAIAEELKDTQYDVTLIPDVALCNLIARNQVSRLLLGAHAVYLHEDKPRFFVNTAGSAALCSVAANSGVPIAVIAENVKISRLPSSDAPSGISYAEEESLYAGLEGSFASLRSEGLQLHWLNVGYDLCEFPDNSTLYTEDHEWSL